ncbi:MAG: cytochrome P450 [Solirubrobacterales bacterium]
MGVSRVVSPEGIDLSATAFWHRPPAERAEAFEVLRREAPVSWQRPPESVLIEPEESSGGYWAVVRHEHVRAVSRDPETFCSGRGVMLEDAPQELLDAAQSFLPMDAPRHTKLRGLVQKAFSPHQVKRISEQITGHALRIVDELESELGSGAELDFVERVSKRLPMMTLWGMMGVPEAERDRLTERADELVSWNDPEVVGDREPAELLFNGILELTAAALELAGERRSEPVDDLMSALVAAEVDGERLADEEISSFFVLLAVAGNDTTRHTTSHAMRALCEFPEQRALLAEDLPGRIEGAVEEFVRWASPVMTFRRTATRDTELGGQAIAEGEKVVLFYTAANRDPAAFPDPERFDVLRAPNRHVGFGGGGPHYCLGAALARTQLRSIFTELLTRLPELEVGEPEPLIGNFVNGVKRMPAWVGAR